jgi:hypothetical protein
LLLPIRAASMFDSEELFEYLKLQAERQRDREERKRRRGDVRSKAKEQQQILSGDSPCEPDHQSHNDASDRDAHNETHRLGHGTIVVIVALLLRLPRHAHREVLELDSAFHRHIR